MTNKNERSRICNCQIIARNDQYIFTNGIVGDGREPLFKGSDEGDVIVNLDGYLICPLEMFTPRQIKMANRKMREARNNGVNAS